MSERLRGSLARETRGEIRLLWRSFVLPAVLVLCALLAITNVVNAAGMTRSDYALLQHTRSEYAANHMNFLADLHRPATIKTSGDGETVSNLARYDYDTLATDIVNLSPASSVAETLKYLGFVLFPAVFFMLGLWMSIGQRRYCLEKVKLVRVGTAGTLASRQLALLVVSAIVIAVTLAVDVVGRAIAQAVVSSQLPLHVFVPLAAAPVQNPALQWSVILIATVFFGAAGLAVGAFAGIFALPAILFVIWDYVVPILGLHDPRNWFEVLGHSVFTYSSAFQLAPPIPLSEPIAFVAASACSIALVAVGYVGMRVRNPRAT